MSDLDLRRGVYEQMNDKEQYEMLCFSIGTPIGRNEKGEMVMAVGSERMQQIVDFVKKMNDKYYKPSWMEKAENKFKEHWKKQIEEHFSITHDRMKHRWESKDKIVAGSGLLETLKKEKEQSRFVQIKARRSGGFSPIFTTPKHFLDETK